MDIINFVMSSDDDSDDGNVNNYVEIEEQRRILVFRVRQNYFEIFNEKQFVDRFRFSKNSTQLLLNRLAGHFELFSERNDAVRPITQLLIILRFLATASFYITVGDFIGISKSTVCKTVHILCRTIASLRNEFIRFPSTEEQIIQNQVEFHQIARFIRAVGCIDCKHV